MMRKMLLAAAVGLIAVSVAGTGYALDKEKTLTQITNADRDPGPWGSTDYCTLSYYNFCTGWIYVWSGWTASDVVGLAIDPANCPPKAEECATLLGAWIFFLDAYPTYGFTAALGCAAQGNEPGHLEKLTYLGDPQEWADGWNFADLANCHVGGGGAVVVHMVNPGPLAVVTEALPLACGGGSRACTSCAQPASSYYYGQLATLGSGFSGSLFTAGVYYPASNDLLIDAIVCCLGPTAVESSSWGKVKAMFE